MQSNTWEKNYLFEFDMIKYFIKINDKVMFAVTQFKKVGNIIDKIRGGTSRYSYCDLY